MKLGVLGRTVVVASCFWMIGGTFFIAKSTADKAALAADSCARTAASVCSESWADVYGVNTHGGGFWDLWGFAAFEAAMILVLALILLAAVYWTVQWILAGRQSKVRS